MKNLLFLSIVLVFSFASCEKDDLEVRKSNDLTMETESKNILEAVINGDSLNTDEFNITDLEDGKRFVRFNGDEVPALMFWYNPGDVINGEYNVADTNLVGIGLSFRNSAGGKTTTPLGKDQSVDGVINIDVSETGILNASFDISAICKDISYDENDELASSDKAFVITGTINELPLAE